MRRHTHSSVRVLCSVLFVTAVVGAACGSEDPTSAGTDSAASGRIVVYGATGVFEETINEEIIPRFTEETGIEVLYQGVHSADVLTRVLGQGDRQEASLVMLNDVDAARGQLDGLWSELDLAALPVIDELPDNALDPAGTTVSLSLGAWGIAYNPEALENAGLSVPSSWADLFSADYANRSLVFDFTIGPGPYVIWALDRAIGPGPDDYSHVLDFIGENRNNVLAFPSQVAEWDQLFEQGAAWVGLTSNARVALLQDAGVTIDFAYPDEGAPAFEIRGAIPEGAPNPAAASEFLAYLLEPEQQVLQGEALYYSPVHPDATLPDDIADRTPQEHMDDVVFADPEELLRIREEVIPLTQPILEG